MQTCENCGNSLSTNEIGISLRLLGRSGEHLRCRECLAQQLKVDPTLIDKKIEQFRKMGCPLFV